MVICVQICRSEFTQKTGTCELCPSPLCPSVYQKQLAAGQKLGLVDLLYEEGKFVSIQSRMVRDETLERYQRKEYKVLNEKLFALWSKFNSGDIGAKELLRDCGKLYGSVHKKQGDKRRSESPTVREGSDS